MQFHCVIVCLSLLGRTMKRGGEGYNQGDYPGALIFKQIINVKMDTVLMLNFDRSPPVGSGLPTLTAGRLTRGWEDSSMC